MKKILLTFTSVWWTLISCESFALGSGEIRGTVEKIFIYPDTSLLTFRLIESDSEDLSAGHSCNTSNKYAFLTTDLGADATLASLLTAKSTGTEIVVKRSGTCTKSSGSEDFSYLILMP